MTTSYLLQNDKKYIRADPIRPDKSKNLKKNLYMLAVALKSTIFAFFVFIKYFICLFIPTTKKSIENKVALVCIKYLVLFDFMNSSLLISNFQAH